MRGWISRCRCGGRACRCRPCLADLTKQTGVQLVIWPADAAEARTGLTLYLNPQKPPSLREVLVQVKWVLDCTITYSETNGVKTYYLLGNPPSDAVAKRLAAAAQTRARRSSRADERASRRRACDRGEHSRRGKAGARA